MERKRKTKLSKHAIAYLKMNGELGLGNGYTISTYVTKFIGYFRYADSYRYQIWNCLNERPDIAFRFVSQKNAEAFYPVSMLEGKNKKKYKTILAMYKLNPKMNVHKVARDIFK